MHEPSHCVCCGSVSPPALSRDRANITAQIVAWGQPFGAALGGLLADAIDVRVALLVMAGGVAASGIYGWCSPLREVTDEGSFDALVSRLVLWTLLELEAAVREWRRCTRPGGRIAAINNRYDSPSPLARLHRWINNSAETSLLRQRISR